MNSEVYRSKRNREKSPFFLVLAYVGRRQEIEMEKWRFGQRRQMVKWAAVGIPESLQFPRVMVGIRDRRYMC